MRERKSAYSACLIMKMSVQDALNVLREKYRMVGSVSAPNTESHSFESAFGCAVAVNKFEIFKFLPPLLIVNDWNVEKLIAATPANLYGRLRLLCAIADFFIDFGRNSMKPPISNEPAQIREKLNEVEGLLSDHSMRGELYYSDRFMSPGFSSTGGLFAKHGLNDVDWQLNTFWACYGETIKLVKQRLDPVEYFNPFPL